MCLNFTDSFWIRESRRIALLLRSPHNPRRGICRLSPPPGRFWGYQAARYPHPSRSPSLRRYADLLQKKLDRHGTHCFLVNTGWTGGGYGVGKRMSLKDTRACVDSVLNGTINKSSFTTDPVSAARSPRLLEIFRRLLEIF